MGLVKVRWVVGYGESGVGDEGEVNHGRQIGKRW
jgi:hypothetical protein